MTPILVGFDIGATKTSIAFQPVHGGAPALFTVPSPDWNAEPVGPAARWIAERLAAVVPGGTEVAAIAIGAQGCDTTATCSELGRALSNVGIDALVVNDAALLVPASGLDDGMGVISGTGAIAVGRDRAGADLIAGGWGSILGDDAGAAGLVRDATRTVLAAWERRLMDDGLLTALLEAFGVDGPAALARTVNDEPTVEHWAPKAIAVFTAADSGSARAAAVVDGGARHLAELVSLLADRGAVGRVVVAAGSVIVHQPRLFNGFSARLAETVPGLTTQLLTEPPVVGALALARRRLSGGASGRPPAATHEGPSP